MSNAPRLILASQSPRRAELLARLGLVVGGEVIQQGAALAARDVDGHVVEEQARRAEEEDGEHGGSIKGN